MKQETFSVDTQGRGTYDLTARANQIVTGVETGLAHIFSHHTSCSLMLCENADPDVRRDLETFMQDEGPDDMPAHIRSILTGMDLTVPVMDGKLGLGTWQGVYLWEHRVVPHRRKITVTVQT